MIADEFYTNLILREFKSFQETRIVSKTGRNDSISCAIMSYA